jgi:hypothetical protein
MEILIAAVMIPVVLIPVALIWYINASGLYKVMKDARARQKARALKSVKVAAKG